MTDENVIAEQASNENKADSMSVEPYINPDGTLKEGWQEHFIPEDFKNRPCYKAIGNDLKSIMRHIGNQDIAISRQGKGIFVPGPDATPSEIAEFHKAIGVPDSPDKYDYVPPKELAEYYKDSELFAEAKRVAHQYGVTPKAFNALMELDAKRAAEFEKDLTENPLEYYEKIKPYAQAKLMEQAEAELRKRWGDQYENRLQLANLAIAETYPEGEDRDRIVERINSDPMIADFLATVQLRHHTEAKGIDTTIGSGVDKRSLDQRIEDINLQLTRELRINNRTKYDALLEERSRLYNMRYPESGKQQ